MTLEERVKALEEKTTHKKLVYEISNDFAEFNKLIDLPQHPSTLKHTALMPYQTEFINLIPENINRLFHINKSRQIGATELILRTLAFHSFFKYKGGKILIIAGTREKTAAKLMNRFKQLFRNIPWAVAETKGMLNLKLNNGTEVEALPSNSDAIRGDTKIKAIFVDEAAHFNLNDDSVVMDALEPIIFTNKADLFLVSTPNGKRGFFYEISENENKYFKIKWDYTVAIGFIYEKIDIETELERKDIDVEQEYMCQFTTSRTTVFGHVNEEDYQEVIYL